MNKQNKPLTIARADDFNGVMMNIDTNDVLSDITSDLKMADILDGCGRGTIVSVNRGRCWLCNGLLLTNADVGVIVNPRTELELSYVTIDAGVPTPCIPSGAKRCSIYLTDATSKLYINSFESGDGRNVSIKGVVYLGADAYITVKNKLCSTKLKVQCENPVSGMVIAKGTDNYLLTTEDFDKITVEGQPCMLDILHNQIVLI